MLVGLAESVIAHRQRPVRPARVEALAVEQLERHPDLREFLVHPIPVRLRMDTLVLTPPGEQPRIHFRVEIAAQPSSVV